jgi:hypothetical protein
VLRKPPFIIQNHAEQNQSDVRKQQADVCGICQKQHSIFSTSWLWYFLLLYPRSRRTPKEGLPGCSPPASQIEIETTQILFIIRFTRSTFQLQSATDNCWWLVESSWNVMAHCDAWEGKWRGNWWKEWVASTLHTTSDHGVSSITTADAHTSAASSRLNWHPSTDLSGLVRFAERWNLVSARVPSHFKQSLHHNLESKIENLGCLRWN